jgi:hypothetical protein
MYGLAFYIFHNHGTLFAGISLRQLIMFLVVNGLDDQIKEEMSRASSTNGSSATG